MDHQDRGAVDHGRVHHLALAALDRLQQPAHHAEGEEHAPATEISHHVHRRNRTLAGAPEVRQRTGQRDVVDVVARRVGVHARLPPPGHAPEHQARVARQAHVGPDPQTLHHTGTEALDQRVGGLHQLQQRLHALGVFQIDGDVATTALQDVEARRVGCRTAHRLAALDANHLGAHVGQHHRRERTGSDSGDLDDSVTS